MAISKAIQEERNDAAGLDMQRAMGRERASKGRERGEPPEASGPLTDPAFLDRVPLTLEAQEDHLERTAAARRMAAEDAQEAIRYEGGRMPFGEPELSLYHEEIPGFRLYWFNDQKDRIYRAKRAGYEHVTDRNGEPIARVVSREGPREVKGYLMKIPIEYYKADKAAAERRETNKIAEIRAGVFQAGQGDNRYVPSQGIHIREGR